MLYRMFLVLLLPALAQAKSNIVFMMADDLGWNDVGYHGSQIKTPNIDALAEKGVELDRYYAFPVCSPTRAALMTGRSPIRQGVDMAIGAHGGMPLDEHLLPQTLRAAGYQTFVTGKWHLGMEHTASHPNSRGFDHEEHDLIDENPDLAKELSAAIRAIPRPLPQPAPARRRTSDTSRGEEAWPRPGSLGGLEGRDPRTVGGGGDPRLEVAEHEAVAAVTLDPSRWQRCQQSGKPLAVGRFQLRNPMGTRSRANVLSESRCTG